MPNYAHVSSLTPYLLSQVSRLMSPVSCPMYFMQNLGQKWLELAPFFFHANSTNFFTLAPMRCAPPFFGRTSGAVALKLAQVPSTVIWKL